MAGYIGSNISVTAVSAETDSRYVIDPNDVITVSGSNVGIGTSSPEGLVALPATASNTPKFRLQSDTTNTDFAISSYADANGTYVSLGANHYFNSSGNDAVFEATDRSAYISLDARNSGAVVFGTNSSGIAAERCRIDSSGNLLVGRASRVNAEKVGIYFVGTTHNGLTISDTQATGDFTRFFASTSTQVGSISHTSSSTSYNTSSDYRLKENVTTLDGAADRLAKIPVHRFNFIADPNTVVDGFLAHEVQAIVPEAVTGEKDAMRDEEYEVAPAVYDDEGNLVSEAVMGTRSVPDYQGIDQSKLVPLLTAALQEALQKIDALEARVAALEGGAT